MTTNDIRHTIDVNNKKSNAIISIRLNDDCKNGHEDFSITASFYEIGKARTESTRHISGCCHDEILKIRPELKQFVDLHLRDWNGAPMYALENGYYHVHRMDEKGFAEYFGCSNDEAAILQSCGDKLHFQYLIEVLGIPEKWEQRAKVAIEVLEGMTRYKFESKATRRHYEPMSDLTKKEVEDKVNSGYYEAERIAERKDAALQKAIADYKQSLTAEIDTVVEKMQRERAVKVWLADLMQRPKPNCIFYTHNNTLALNFSSWDELFSDTDIEFIAARANRCPVKITVTKYKS